MQADLKLLRIIGQDSLGVMKWGRLDIVSLVRRKGEDDLLRFSVIWNDAAKRVSEMIRQVETIRHVKFFLADFKV